MYAFIHINMHPSSLIYTALFTVCNTCILYQDRLVCLDCTVYVATILKSQCRL